jgi:hypothetical protein
MMERAIGIARWLSFCNVDGFSAGIMELADVYGIMAQLAHTI